MNCSSINFKIYILFGLFTTIATHGAGMISNQKQNVDSNQIQKENFTQSIQTWKDFLEIPLDSWKARLHIH